MKTTSHKKSVKRSNAIKSPASATNNSTKSITSPKVNVFQFMMDSRHKVIGSNSPGKEKKLEKPQSSEEIAKVKQKLTNRREIFAEWSERKGGLKRKLMEEAQEKHINDTILSRGKRLKQMLEIIDESLRNSSHDEETDEDVKGDKHSSQINENIVDNEIIKKLKIKEKSSQSKFNRKLTDRSVIKNTKHNRMIKTTKSKQGSNKSLILKCDESCNKPMDTKINKSKKGKTNLRSKNKNEESFQNFKKFESKSSVKRSVIIKDNSNIIDTKEKEETRQGDTNSTTDEETKEHDAQEKSDNNNKIDTLVTQINKNILVEMLKKSDEQVKLSNDSKPKRKSRKGSLSLIKSNDSDVSFEPEKEIKITDASDEEIFPSRSLVSKTPLSSQNTRQSKLFKNIFEKNTPVKNDVTFSPRKWRMKVRLFEKENVKTENKSFDTDESVIVVDDGENTSKKVQGKISNFFTVHSSISSLNPDTQKSVKLAPLFVRQVKQTKAEIESKRHFLRSGIPEQMKKTIATQKR